MKKGQRKPMEPTLVKRAALELTGMKGLSTLLRPPRAPQDPSTRRVKKPWKPGDPK